jgi:hypothetical protein
MVLGSLQDLKAINSFLATGCWPGGSKSSDGYAISQPLDWLNTAFPQY